MIKDINVAKKNIKLRQLSDIFSNFLNNKVNKIIIITTINGILSIKHKLHG